MNAGLHFLLCQLDDRGNRTNKGRGTWQTIVNQIKVVRSRAAANKVAASKAGVSRRVVSKATRETSKAAAGKANVRLD